MITKKQSEKLAKSYNAEIKRIIKAHRCDNDELAVKAVMAAFRAGLKRGFVQGFNEHGNIFK